jgi:hypothetical protein
MISICEWDNIRTWREIYWSTWSAEQPSSFQGILSASWIRLTGLLVRKIRPIYNFRREIYASLTLNRFSFAIYYMYLLQTLKRQFCSNIMSLFSFQPFIQVEWLVTKSVCFFGHVSNINRSVHDPIKTTHSSQGFSAILFISAQFPLHYAKSRSVYCG